MKSGIYKITNTVNMKLYIGKSNNVKQRIRSHRWDLKYNKHHNPYLQKSWNKYGEDKFLFEIIEYCAKDIIYEREDYWAKVLRVHDHEYGYNITETNSDTRTIYSNGTGEKISKSLIKVRGIPVVILDLDGNYIGEADCASSAGKYVGAAKSTGILKADKEEDRKRGLYRPINGYRFVRKDMYKPEEGYSMKIMRRQVVCKYSLDGKFIEEYSSMLSAAKANNTRCSNIGKCCRYYLIKEDTNKKPQCKGYVYKYKNYKGRLCN